MLTPSGFPNGATCTDRGANAPPDTNATDLKFLHHELRNQGTGSVPESDVPIRGIGEPP
jgi:hypothetical protein